MVRYKCGILPVLDNPPSPRSKVASLVISRIKLLKRIDMKDLCLKIPRTCD